MSAAARYRVLLLPLQEIAVEHCTLGEALAYQQGYHEIVGTSGHEAVIAAEMIEPATRVVPPAFRWRAARSRRVLARRSLERSA